MKNIVEKLESEDIDLDKSISLYEEGLKLSKELNEQLSKYDKLIDKINKEHNEQ